MACMSKTIAACFTVLLSFVNPCVVGAQEKADRGAVSRFTSSETVHSDGLNEDREIRIHLPSDYHTSSKKYPSLYVLDGENSDRLNTAISAITYLSRVRKLPQMIVIGVFNTDRTRDMTPEKIEQRKGSGEGDAFLEFVVSELHPHVDSRYRTAPCRVLFGGSSAGTFTLYALFSEPESFTGYVASRPVLNSLVDYTWDADVIRRNAKRLFEDRPSLKGFLYIDYGETEDALHDPGSIRQLSDILESSAPRDFRWEIRAMAESGYRSAESLIDGLLAMFDGWYYSADSIYTNGFEGIDDHASMLSERFGYRITVGDLLVEADLLMFGHRFLEREKPQEAVKLFEYAVTMNPDSWGALHGLAEAHMKDGQEGLAAELYKRLLKLNPENEYAAEKLRQLE